MRTCKPLLRKAVSGVEEGRYFCAMRAQILADLRTNTNDRSLAGRVDPQIADLVEYINTSFPQYVTSSSCSGRVSLFHRWTTSSSSSNSTDSSGVHDAAKAAESGDEVVGLAALERRKRGALGRGTVFQSHDPLPSDPNIAVQQHLVPALEEFWAWRRTQAEGEQPQASEVLQLKFEPMILHVLCADFDAASELLKCASESGQMNSGIVSCSRGTKANRKITCCITSPLCLDVPLCARGKWGLPPDNFRSYAWELLLGVSVSHVNDLFHENAERRCRFEAELRHRTQRAAAAELHQQQRKQQQQQEQQQRKQQSEQPAEDGKRGPAEGTSPAVNSP